MQGGRLLAGLSALLCILLNPGTSEAQLPKSCTTPRGEPGSCISIRSCASLLSLLEGVTQPLPTQLVNLLRASQCGLQDNTPMVCCPQQTTAPPRSNPGIVNPFNNPFITYGQEPSTVPTNNIESDISSNPLLPTNCGQDLSQRIVGGERTELGEYPWMVLLEYRKPNGRTTGCGGVLINSRYILTAAHCIKGKDLPSSWSLETVRLGEYDTDTELDCIYDKGKVVMCADDPVTVGIEERIVHENYRPLSRDQKYDIALLRLNRNVAFTSYIKPICLPSNATIGSRLFVAGWGKTEVRSNSNVKLKLALPLSDQEACDDRYRRVNVGIGYGQICAGGEPGADSCRGDSGGPLMAVERGADGRGRFTSVGVVSFGPSPCGMPGWPGVYTKVFDFVPWIISKLRP